MPLWTYSYFIPYNFYSISILEITVSISQIKFCEYVVRYCVKRWKLHFVGKNSFINVYHYLKSSVPPRSAVFLSLNLLSTAIWCEYSVTTSKSYINYLRICFTYLFLFSSFSILFKTFILTCFYFSNSLKLETYYLV